MISTINSEEFFYSRWWKKFLSTLDTFVYVARIHDYMCRYEGYPILSSTLSYFATGSWIFQILDTGHLPHTERRLFLDIKFGEYRWKGPDFTAIRSFKFLADLIFKIIDVTSYNLHTYPIMFGILGIKFVLNRERCSNFIKRWIFMFTIVEAYKY